MKVTHQDCNSLRVEGGPRLEQLYHGTTLVGGLKKAAREEIKTIFCQRPLATNRSGWGKLGGGLLRL